MAIELAEMIGQLRSELITAMAEGESSDLRFELGPVGLELTVALTKEAAPGAKVRFWIVEAGVDTKASSTTTQTIKLQLEPRRVGQRGRPLISGEAQPGER
jgi:hypothetical protein